MEITKDQLAHIISTTIMCVKDEHPNGVLGAAKVLSITILAITNDVDLAQHAKDCVIAAWTSDED